MLWSNTLKCFDWHWHRSLILESTYFVLINIWKWSVYQLSLITLPYQHRLRVLYLAGKLYRIICNNLTTAWHCHAHRIFLFKFVCITYLKRTIIFSNDWPERNGIILLFLHITARRAFVIVRLRLYCYWIRWYSRQIFKYPQNLVTYIGMKSFNTFNAYLLFVFSIQRTLYIYV